MSAVPEEVLKETAATSEPPNRLASPEFFFLLQRIDRLDEKLSREIKDVDLKLSARIDTLDEKLSREIKEVDLKLSARIDSLDEKLSARINRLDEKIDRVDDKLSGRINRVEEKIDRLQDRLDLVQDRVDTIKFWAIGAVITLIAGFAGVIITLLQR